MSESNGDSISAADIDADQDFIDFARDMASVWIKIRKNSPEVTLDNVVQLYIAQQAALQNNIISNVATEFEEKLDIIACAAENTARG